METCLNFPTHAELIYQRILNRKDKPQSYILMIQRKIGINKAGECSHTEQGELFALPVFKTNFTLLTCYSSDQKMTKIEVKTGFQFLERPIININNIKHGIYNNW